MRFIPVLIAVLILSSCSKGITKILKNPDPEYKLRIAEQYFVKKKYNKAQVIYEDIMPYFKTRAEFQDIYYKYAYCAYNQEDFMNAENLFKSFLEIFPNSPKSEEVDYMRAFSYYKQSPKPELDQTNTIKAMGMMQTFINTHPGSAKNKEAQEIIDACRRKLEIKDYKAALLYFDMGQFRAAGVAFASLLNGYPESMKADEYKLMIIRSYYRYAELSVEEKKPERFEQVIDECHDFVDRFPESKLRKDAENFLNLSQTQIKNLNNEQVKRQLSAGITNNVETKSLDEIKKKTGNIYESIAIIGKRANQINISLKEELHNKLDEFASHTDSLEEIHENKEQIEISRAYERMPNPALLATQEFMEDKVYFRKGDDELFS